MSSQQEELVEMIIQSLEKLDKNDPKTDKLASYLYVADKRLSDYLAELRVFLKCEQPSQDQRIQCGYILEQIVYLCFRGLKGATSFKSFQSAGPQYDLLISGDDQKWKTISELFYLPFEKRNILVEAKAKQSKLTDKDFARLCSIMDVNLSTTGLGIFFTFKGATGFPDRSSSTRQRKIGDCRLRQALFHAKTGKYIIVFDQDDIFELASNGSLIKLIVRKIRDLQELSGLPPISTEEWIEIDLPEHLRILEYRSKE